MTINLTWVDPIDAFSFVEISVGNTATEVSAGLQRAEITVPLNHAFYTITVKAVDATGSKSEGVIVRARSIGKILRNDGYDGLGALIGYSIYEYNSSGNWTGFSSFDAGGVLSSYRTRLI